MRMWEDFAPKFSNKTGCWSTKTHRFPLGNFSSRTTWLSSPTDPTHLTKPIASFFCFCNWSTAILT
jgi:hypothetical protein